MIKGALIGDPVAYSLSKWTHEKIFADLQVDASYTRVVVNEHNLEKTIKNFRDSEEYAWVAVTMPCKEKILPYLDEISEEADQVGAVNTVIINKGSWKGYNFDGIGAVNAIEKKRSLNGQHVCVLGAGATGKAVAFAAKQKGARVSLWNRHLNKGREVARLLGVDHVKNIPDDVSIFVNATPLGMMPHVNTIPIDAAYIKKGMVVLDVVMNPLETAWMYLAKQRGATVISGSAMFAELTYLQFSHVFTNFFCKRTCVEKIYQYIPQGGYVYGARHYHTNKKRLLHTGGS